MLVSTSLPSIVLAAVAAAGPAEGTATEASASALTSEPATEPAIASAAAPKSGKTKDRGSLPWLERWAPERNVWELGLYAGVWVPSKNHELYQADLNLADQGFRPFARVAPAIGGRVGYYPLRVLGIEGEVGGMPAKTDADQRAGVWTARAYVVGQLGFSNIVPFLLLGGGGMGVTSDRAALGKDTDALLHFGGGFKVYLHRYVVVRVDVRDSVSAKQGKDSGLANNVEFLGGLSITLGRKHTQPPAPVVDSDSDGFKDDVDKCKDEKGVAPDGCPIRDTDEDGFKDDVDKCAEEAGVDPDGCPVRDTDEDGFKDDVDNCKDEKGVAPDGCPIRDTDGDSMLDDVDKCPSEAEVVNGFDDTDGCPDEIPKEVEQFSGVIEGILFDSGKAKIKPKSFPVLDQAIAALTKFPTIRVEIVGHTDNAGKRERNVDLSQKRAEAVKTYMVEHGIDAARIVTRGAGPDEPIGDNKTSAGRGQNRRIEFKRLMQ